MYNINSLSFRYWAVGIDGALIQQPPLGFDCSLYAGSVLSLYFLEFLHLIFLRGLGGKSPYRSKSSLSAFGGLALLFSVESRCGSSSKRLPDMGSRRELIS